MSTPRCQLPVGVGRNLVLFIASLVLSACASTSAETPSDPLPRALGASEPGDAPRKTPLSSPLRIVAVGDIMLGTDFPRDLLPAPDQPLLAPLTPYLQDADITLGNLEGVLMDGGEPVKACRSEQHCYRFRTPTRFAEQLRDAGFDALSLANNHARDFGEQGRQQTMQALRAVGIRHSGQQGDVASWTQDGRRIAFIAFAPFRGANNPLDIERAAHDVRRLSRSHDIVLVSMHMGAEGEEYTRIPFEPEFFHGEARGDVVAFARAVVDAGADAVLGHGPHVPRAMELYGDRLIAYSLGNFCTYWGINVRDVNGLAPLLRFEIDAEGRFLSGEIISARQIRPDGPLPDPAFEAARLMAELTRMDFPETGLLITPRGRVIRTRPLPRAFPQTAAAADKDGVQR